MCTVEYWYDRHTRSWVVQVKDDKGNQVGKAHYFGNKEEAIKEADRISNEYGYPNISSSAKKTYREKTKQISVEFNTETEYDLLEHILSQPNRQSYIKNLIKNDIESGK